MVPGNTDMCQHIISINKLVSQEIFSIEKIKRRRVQIHTQEILRDILLPERPLSQWRRAPLNFSC